MAYQPVLIFSLWNDLTVQQLYRVIALAQIIQLPVNGARFPVAIGFNILYGEQQYGRALFRQIHQFTDGRSPLERRDFGRSV